MISRVGQDAVHGEQHHSRIVDLLLRYLHQRADLNALRQGLRHHRAARHDLAPAALPVPGHERLAACARQVRPDDGRRDGGEHRHAQDHRAGAVGGGAVTDADGLRGSDQDVLGRIALADGGDQVPAGGTRHERQPYRAPAARAERRREQVERERGSEAEDGGDPPPRRDQLGQQAGGAGPPRRRQHEAGKLGHGSHLEGERPPGRVQVSPGDVPGRLGGHHPGEGGPEDDADREEHRHQDPQRPPPQPGAGAVGNPGRGGSR